jgi:hypothetical protein
MFPNAAATRLREGRSIRRRGRRGCGCPSPTSRHTERPCTTTSHGGPQWTRRPPDLWCRPRRPPMPRRPPSPWKRSCVRCASIRHTCSFTFVIICFLGLSEMRLLCSMVILEPVFECAFFYRLCGMQEHAFCSRTRFLLVEIRSHEVGRQMTGTCLTAHHVIIRGEE